MFKSQFNQRFSWVLHWPTNIFWRTFLCPIRLQHQTTVCRRQRISFYILTYQRAEFAYIT